MKQKLSVLLVCEALACTVLCLFAGLFADAFTSLFAFPFEQIGAGLRALSTSGTAGNIIAVCLYGTVSLLPAAYLVLRIRKGRAYAEDGLLALLSIVLFVVIYLMINPAYIARHFASAEILGASKAFLGATVYSIAAGYLILYALRIFKNSGTGSVYKYLKILLSAVCVVLIYGIFGTGLMGLIDSFGQLTAGNTAPGQNLGPSYVFLILQYLVGVLPLFLEIVIVYSGIALLQALEKDPYSKAVTGSAQKIGRICRYAVAAIMLSQIGVNVLQLALGSLVRSSHYTLSIPLLSVVFVLAAMLLAHYFEQARRLKDDNDMFI